MDFVGIGQISLAGAASLVAGEDRWTTTLASDTQLPDGTPVVCVRVGRQEQPLDFAGFHVDGSPGY